MEAGLKHVVVSGHKDRADYVLEAMGCGVAFLDYDNDGWLDILVLCGSRFMPCASPDMPEISDVATRRKPGILRRERGTRYVWDYGYLSVQGRVRLAERADGHRRQ